MVINNLMSVYKIKNTWWVDIGHLGTRIRKKSPENSRTGALAYESVLRGKLSRNEPLKPPKDKVMPTFQEFAIEQWFPTYVVVNNKPSEIRQKQITLKKHMLPYFGRMRINDITGKEIESYKALKIDEGYARKTINNHLAMLGKCLRSAQEWRELDKIPTFRMLKVPPQSYDFLTDEEVPQILGAIDNPFWHTMVLTALHTGLRVGELLGLQWPDIDFSQRILTVRRSIVHGIVGSPKNNKARLVPLTPALWDSLYTHRKAEGWVFAQPNGKSFYRETPLRTLHRYCQKAGLRPVGWHSLRHTFATHLAIKGASPKAVQELLGHSSIMTTMRYMHITPTALREAVALLDPCEPKDNKAPLRQHSDNHQEFRQKFLSESYTQ